MSQLRECPFCHERAKEDSVDRGINESSVWYFVQCMTCECRTDDYTDIKDAIETWNTRHPQQDVQGLVDALLVLLSECDAEIIAGRLSQKTFAREKAKQALKSYQEGRT